MYISKINNSPNFNSKITYNRPIKKCFEIANKQTNSTSLKDLNKTKDFIDDIITIMDDKSVETTHLIRIKETEQQASNNDINIKYFNIINEYASKIKPTEKKQNYLDKLQEQANGILGLLELLNEDYSNSGNYIESTSYLLDKIKNNYRNAIKEKLYELETKISNNK